jgi:putative DNA primase/helicase
MNEKDIAGQVEQRAKDLLADVVEEKAPLDGQFVTACLKQNELGDGLIYTSLHEDKFLRNVTPKEPEWYVWDKHVWVEDPLCAAALNAVEGVSLEYQLQHDILDAEIKDQGIEKGGEDGWKIPLRDKFSSRIDRLRTDTGAQKVLKWAGRLHNSRMSCKESAFNKKPMLLPTPNGVIDLSTGELVRGCPADMMNKQVPVEYDKHAEYGKWHDTLCEISNDEEIVAFLKRSFGYAITGHSFEQYIWLFLGPGRNGKGIMFNLLIEILGPFFHEISPAMLLEQRSPPSPAAASEHLYSLLGKRLLSGSETNKGQKIDASAVKRLTGEDEITCRPNFGREITFSPSHSIFLRSQYVPRGMTEDFAMVQRLLLINFPFRYVDDVEAEKRKFPVFADQFRKKNKNLKDELRLIKPGILRWLVEGCLEWQEIGLAPPDSIIKAVDDLAAENDDTGQFAEDCLCHFPGSGTRLACSDEMYVAFQWWWAENRDSREQRTPSMKKVNGDLRERGFKTDKIGGKIYVLDAVLNPDVESEVEIFRLSKAKKRT